MTAAPLTLAAGGTTWSVVSARFYAPAKGPWLADVLLSGDDVTAYGMPSGSVSLALAGSTLSGTIDAQSAGVFGPTGRARVVAGANGWSTKPPAADWHADNGVTTTAVYTATAQSVGETLTDLSPGRIGDGVDFARSSDEPAMAVFGDSSWWVDLNGTTYAGTRPSATPDASFVLSEWDPIHQRAAFSSQAVLVPGSTLSDPRLGSTTYTVQNVEQVFTSEGSVGWAWCSSTSSSLIADDLKAAVRYWTRCDFLKMYRYRLQQYQGPGPGGGPSRLALQAVVPAAGMPDLIPIAPWSGMAGVVATLADSQEVLVAFENADPTLPRIVLYSLQGLPQKLSLDAQQELDVGPTVPVIKLAGGGAAVARDGDTIGIGILVADLTTGAVTQSTPPTKLVPGITGIIVAGSSKVSSG